MSVLTVDPVRSSIERLEFALDNFEPHPGLRYLLRLRVLASEYAHRISGGQVPVRAASEAATYLAALENGEELRLSTIGIEQLQGLHGHTSGTLTPTPLRITSVAMRPNAPHARLRLTGATPPKVASRLTDLVEEIVRNPTLRRFEKIALAHFELLRTHPFTDGNGRASRALLTILLKNEYASRLTLGITKLMHAWFSPKVHAA